MYFKNEEAPSTTFFTTYWTDVKPYLEFYSFTYSSRNSIASVEEYVGRRRVVHYARSLYDTETEAWSQQRVIIWQSHVLLQRSNSSGGLWWRLVIVSPSYHTGDYHPSLWIHDLSPFIMGSFSSNHVFLCLFPVRDYSGGKSKNHLNQAVLYRTILISSVQDVPRAVTWTLNPSASQISYSSS